MPNALIHTIEPEGALHAEHDTVLSERNVCIAYHKEGRAALHKTLAGPSFKRWVQPQQLIARDELMDPNGTTTWQGAAARSACRACDAPPRRVPGASRAAQSS